MNAVTFVRATGVALSLLLAAGSAAARSDDPPPDTICTVLGTASRYVGTTVTVRGVAATEGKVTTLSDAQCKGTVNLKLVLWLVIGSVPAAFLSVWVFSRVFGDRFSSVIQTSIGVALLLASMGLIAKGAFSGQRVDDDALSTVVIKPVPTLPTA